MSSNHEKDNADAVFGALEHVRIDPVLRAFFDDAEEAQEALDEFSPLDPDNVSEIIDKLNDDWSKTGLFEQLVSLTAKVRVGAGHDIESVCIDSVCKGNKLHQDEKGAYYELAAEELVCMGFDLDVEYGENGFPGRPRIVLTFVQVDVYEAMQQDGVTQYDGCLAVYSEDLRGADFVNPSPEAVEQYLKYYHPRVYEMINNHIPPGPLGNRRLKTVLNNFKLQLDEFDLKDEVIIDYIGRYITHRLDMASDMFEISIGGDFQTVDTEDKIVSSFDADVVKTVRGYALGVRIVEELSDAEGTYRPQLIVAVPSRDDNGDYEAFLIRGVDVLVIKNLQNIIRYFGAAATRKFESIEDAGEYFRSVAASAYANIPDDYRYSDMEALEAYVDSDTRAASRLQRYDPERKSYIVSISDDLEGLISVFQKLKQKHDVDNLTDKKLQRAYEAIARELYDKGIDFEELKIGDTVEPIGSFVAVTVDESTRDLAPYVSFGGECVSGKFGGITVVPFPDLVSAITLGKAGGSEFQLGMVLHDVISIDATGAVDNSTMSGKTTAIPLTGDVAPFINKIIKAADKAP